MATFRLLPEMMVPPAWEEAAEGPARALLNVIRRKGGRGDPVTADRDGGQGTNGATTEIAFLESAKEFEYEK